VRKHFVAFAATSLRLKSRGIMSSMHCAMPLTVRHWFLAKKN